MQRKGITVFILTAFITGTLLLVYIQFNSSKNIDKLIQGNEALMDEFKANNKLNELEKNIIAVESKLRGAVMMKGHSYVEGLNKDVAAIENNLQQLQQLSDDDSSVLYIDQLDLLVKEKLVFTQQVLDTLFTNGKTNAEKLIANPYGKTLTENIVSTLHKLDSARKKHLAETTLLIDKSGKKAQQFSLILIALVLVCGAGLFWYIINIIRKQLSLIHQLNISEKKVTETARIKENFLANMSHEIRTPMNAILGFTHLLQRQPLNNEAKEYIETIERSSQNLLVIINDILDISKIEAGMMRIESVPFNLRALLHSIKGIFNAKAKEKNIELIVHVDESVPYHLEGDATRLDQILINLAGNALKFTEKGTVSIIISNEGKASATISLGITITDTGIGIEKEKLPVIFDRFLQAEDSVTRNYGGTGLGLSIVKDLVLLQHGTIRVESVLGKGTTFALVIPYKIGNEPTVSATLFSEEKGNSNKYPLTEDRILVAEDNEINQKLLEHLFQNWGILFTLAKNGKEAIEKLQQQKFQLILMDIQMPEMDGYSATREIRQTLEIDTPIVAMTAHVLAGEKEKCLSYGMNDYISKPLDEKKLLQVILHYTKGISPLLNSKDKMPAEKKYQFIDLSYLKEVSGGDKEYEKSVTSQFIEAIPGDIHQLKKSWEEKQINQTRYIAHNMKTTISIMGLQYLLQTSLNVLEYEELSENSFTQHYEKIKSILESSLKEARKFYASL